VKKSSLIQAADKKRDELIDVIRFMAESAGWKVTILNVEKSAQDLNKSFN
jgi:hypothetical protein